MFIMCFVFKLNMIIFYGPSYVLQQAKINSPLFLLAIEIKKMSKYILAYLRTHR